MIDNDKANASIKKTETRAEKLAKGLGSGIKVAAQWGAAITVAAVGAGTALFGMANKAAAATDEIAKGSQRMGVSTKAYQEMEYWASQNGVAQADMEKAVGRLNQRMGEAAGGNKKYSDALEKLGINMDDVRAGTVSTEDAFAKSIQSLSQMENGQEKAALASELFGVKLGRELLPALNDGSLSFEEAKKKAEELGIVLSDDSIDAGVKFTDTMDDIKRSLGAVGTNIGADLMPMFQKFLEWVLAHMPEIREVIKVVFKKIEEFVNIAVDVFTNHLLPIMISIYKWVQENWPTIGAIIKGVFEGIKFVLENILAPVLGFLWELIEAIVNFVSDNFPAMQTTFEDVFGGIGIAVEKVAGFFGGLIDKIKTAWDWLNTWNNTDAKDKNPSYGDGGSFSPGGGDGSGGGGVGGRGPSTTSGYGYHKTGLDYVPYDNYPALLHKGEKILTAEENNGSTLNHTGTIRVEGVNNQNELNSVVEIIMEQLRREVRMA